MKNATFCIGEKKILDSINMTASQGQHIAIVGTVGSGKSRYLQENIFHRCLTLIQIISQA